MTPLLITALLVATAIVYVIDVLDLVTHLFFAKTVLTNTLTLPLAVLGCWIMGTSFRESFILSPATTALSMIISKQTNKGAKVEFLSRENTRNNRNIPGW